MEGKVMEEEDGREGKGLFWSWPKKRFGTEPKRFLADLQTDGPQGPP